MSLSQYSLKQRNGFVIGILLILAVVIAFSMRFVGDGILGAVIMYVLFRPLNIYLQEKRRWKKSIATTVILLLSFICLVLPVFFLITLVVKQVNYYIANPDAIQAILSNINTFAADKLNQPDLIANAINNLKGAAGQFAGSFVNGAAYTFIQLVIMYFILFFTLRDFRVFEKSLTKYLPLRPANTKKLGNALRNMTYSNILGQGLIAIVQGTLVGLGFLIFGIKNPVFWGLISTFLSMIPMFGSPLVFTPAGIIEISNGNNISGFGIIIYGYLIVTTIDNFIRMALGQKIANIHPLITIIGVVIGIPLFGILGILYGPLLISVFIIMLQIYQENQALIIKEAGDKDEEIETET